VLAGTQGAIHFALRNAGDTGHIVDAATLLSELARRSLPGASPVPRSPATPAAPTAPRPYQVETVLGSEAKVVTASFPGSAVSNRSSDALGPFIQPRPSARPSSSIQPSQPRPAAIRSGSQ
jgi:hypothetical protein